MLGFKLFLVKLQVTKLISPPKMDFTVVFSSEKYFFWKTFLFQTFNTQNRNSLLEVFCEKGVFTKFFKIHREIPMCQSLFFNTVADLSTATLLKNRFWHWCFHVNFAKFLRTPLFYKTSANGCFYQKCNFPSHEVMIMFLITNYCWVSIKAEPDERLNCILEVKVKKCLIGEYLF